MVVVSVVISVYSKNRLRYLLDCIDSLKKQSIKPNEIIVVLDPQPSLIDFYKKSLLGNNVKIIVSEKPGLSNARNAGIMCANGSIVAFIDDDAVAKHDWLENHIKTYHDPNVASVGGLIEPLWENGCTNCWFPEELNWVVGCSYKGLPENECSIRNPIGCNMSFKKKVFENVGYFRSDVGRFGKRLLSGEEPELSLRILENDPQAKILYNPSAVVYHRIDNGKTNIKYLCKRSFLEGVSKAMITNYRKGSFSSLSAERSYLAYLLKKAIPSRIKSFYKFESFSQLLILLFSTEAVILGFVFGKLSNVGK